MEMPRILVVEDKEENLKAAKEFFNKLNKFEVDYVTNLEDAKKKLINGTYFLGIFDLDIPIKQNGEVKEKAGLELEELAKKKDNMFYVFYSGGFFHGTPRTRFYFNGYDVLSKKDIGDTYSKDSIKGWEELYNKLIKIGEESTNRKLEKELEDSIKRYIKFVGEMPKIENKALIPYIFDKFYKIFKQKAMEEKKTLKSIKKKSINPKPNKKNKEKSTT